MEFARKPKGRGLCRPRVKGLYVMAASDAFDMPPSRQGGLTLLEIMVAAAVFTVGLVGLMSAISSSMMMDSVAQENNLALDAAREVIERVKAEGFSVLEDRLRTGPTYYEVDTEVTSSNEAAADVVLSTTSAESKSTSEVLSSADPIGASTEDTTVYARTDAASQDEGLKPTWYGVMSCDSQDGIRIDENGDFDVAGLSPCDNDADGKVGHVAVTQVSDDRLEVTVTVRWRGRRGDTEKVLRCRVPDWRRYDAR